MKKKAKLIALGFLIFLSLFLICFGQGFGIFGDLAFVASLAPSGAASVYLVQEDCEGTGTPTGWVDAGTINWDYTAVILDGSQSLYLKGNSSSYTNIPSSSDIWCYAMVRFENMPTNTANILLFSTSGGTLTCGGLSVTASGLWRSYAASTSADSTDTYTNGITYHIWMHFVKGSTGTVNGTNLVYVSTTTTKPATATVKKDTISATNETARFQVGAPIYTGNSNIVDKIRVSLTAIESSPP